MTRQPHWPFGTDATCEARIQPGSALFSTPQKLSYPNGLHIEKAKDGNRHPESGWTRVTRKGYNILSQEMHDSANICQVAFRPDNNSPKALAQKRAARKAQLQLDLGIDVEALKAEIREDLRKAMGLQVKTEESKDLKAKKAELHKALKAELLEEIKATGDLQAEAPKPEPEDVVEVSEPADVVEVLEPEDEPVSILDLGDEDDGEPEVEAPKPKPRSRKKSGVRVTRG